jgi:hypothetical protein
MDTLTVATESFNNIKVSNEMYGLIIKCKAAVTNTADIIAEICDQGLKDNLRPKEIRGIIFGIFRGSFSERQIRRLTPAAVKNQNMIRIDDKKENKVKLGVKFETIERPLSQPSQSQSLPLPQTNSEIADMVESEMSANKEEVKEPPTNSTPDNEEEEDEEDREEKYLEGLDKIILEVVGPSYFNEWINGHGGAGPVICLLTEEIIKLRNRIKELEGVKTVEATNAMNAMNIVDIINKLKPTKEQWKLFIEPEPNWWELVRVGVPHCNKKFGESMTDAEFLEHHYAFVERSKVMKEKQAEIKNQRKPFRAAINDMITTLLRTNKVQNTKEAYRIILDSLKNEYQGLTGNIIYKCLNKYNKSRWAS